MIFQDTQTQCSVFSKDNAVKSNSFVVYGLIHGQELVECLVYSRFLKEVFMKMT